MNADTQPSTSSPSQRPEECFSSRIKRKKAPFSPTEKYMIMNVYKYVHAEKEIECPYETPKITECVSKTAEILVISAKSIYNILREYKKNQNFSPPNKPGPKFNFKDKLNDSILLGIQRKVQELFYKNETPTIKKVLQAIHEDPELPKFSKSTLYKILKHLNFKYGARKKQLCP